MNDEWDEENKNSLIEQPQTNKEGWLKHHSVEENVFTAVFAYAGHMLIPLTQLAYASLRDSGFRRAQASYDTTSSTHISREVLKDAQVATASSTTQMKNNYCTDHSIPSSIMVGIWLGI